MIAGMGGLEISKILGQASRLPDKLVLQPMRGVPELRETLSKNYFFMSMKFFRRQILLPDLCRKRL